MKKFLALLISIVMILGVVSPVGSVLAADKNAKVPIIYIRGNGQTICDADGNEVICDIGDLDFDSDSEDGEDKITEAVLNILLPFLGEGLLLDEWDSYEKAIYDEISPLFEKAILDGNGDPQYGTQVAPKHQEENAYYSDLDHNNYSFYNYGFYYDWRLSPYDVVEDLRLYILEVLDTTGAEQIALTSRCLGGSLLNVYLELYGDEEIPSR